MSAAYDLDGTTLAMALDDYRTRGWMRTFPLPVGEKGPPPVGITGKDATAPDRDRLAEFRRAPVNANLGIAPPQDLLGVDIDQYGDKTGADALRALCGRVGVTLPPSWRSTSRGPNNPSGIRWYRVPPGLFWRTAPLPGVELIAWHHRYAVVWPSVHPEGRAYLWYDDADQPCGIPAIYDDWPDLPWPLIAAWTRDEEEPADFAPAAPQRAERHLWHPKVTAKLDEYSNRNGASRHDTALGVCAALCRLEQFGLPGATSALDQLGEQFIADVSPDRGNHVAAGEWGRMLSGGRVRVETTASTSAVGEVTQLEGANTPPIDDADEVLLRSWRPVDLTDAIAGSKTRPAPTILRRSDGRALIYEGQINYLHGADGVGKSFIALFAAVQVLNDSGHVVWLDWEDPDETTVVARLLDLGVTPDVIAERFHYLHPETESTDLAIALVADLIRQTHAQLCVLDSVGEALGIDGVNEDKDAEVTPWMRRVLRPLARAGAAVLPIDHGVKSGDNPLHPSGSKRKRAQVTGAHYLVESPRPISQEYAGGTLKLTCAKDRHGNFTRGKPAAVIDIGIYPDGGWTVHVHPPEIIAAGDNDKTLARAIVRVVKELAEEMGSPPSKNQVESSDRVRASAAKKRAAIEYAEALGCIRTEPGGPGRPTLCVYLKALEP